MGKLKNIFEYTVQEMRGKLDQSDFRPWAKLSKSLLYGQDTTVNYSRNDYDLFRSLWYASVYNGKGKEYLLGAPLAKPIVNIAAAFTIGTGISAELTEYGQEKTQQLSDAEDEINRWLEQNTTEIMEWVKHSYRDGDGYLYIDELGDIDELDAATVEVVLDTMSGAVIGFDVEEIVEERKPDETRTIKYKIVKRYRKDSIKYDEYDENNKFVKTLYFKVFTDEGAITPEPGQEFLADQLVERALPVIHFPNEREPRQIYGNSDYQSLLILFMNYHKVLANATKGVIYNSTPVPYIKGRIDDDGLATGSHADEDDRGGEDKHKVSWNPDNILYLDGDGDAGFIQAQGIMEDVGKLLEYYFYLIVQNSETPEFAFGTAVTSSKASTETQMPVLIQKADRKRKQLERPIQLLIGTYIDRQIRLSNPTFLGLRDMDLTIHINYPSLVEEDRTLNLEIIKFLNEAGIITDKTTLEQLMSGKIADAESEIEEAREETEEAVKRSQAFPDQSNRLEDELGNGDGNAEDEDETA